MKYTKIFLSSGISLLLLAACGTSEQQKTTSSDVGNGMSDSIVVVSDSVQPSAIEIDTTPFSWFDTFYGELDPEEEYYINNLDMSLNIVSFDSIIFTYGEGEEQYKKIFILSAKETGEKVLKLQVKDIIEEEGYESCDKDAISDFGTLTVEGKNIVLRDNKFLMQKSKAYRKIGGKKGYVDSWTMTKYNRYAPILYDKSETNQIPIKEKEDWNGIYTGKLYQCSDLACEGTEELDFKLIINSDEVTLSIGEFECALYIYKCGHNSIGLSIERNEGDEVEDFDYFGSLKKLGDKYYWHLYWAPRFGNYFDMNNIVTTPNDCEAILASKIIKHGENDDYNDDLSSPICDSLLLKRIYYYQGK